MRSVLGVVLAVGSLTACAATPYEGDPLTYPPRRTESTSDELATEEEADDEPSNDTKPKGVCSGETSGKTCFQCCTEEAPAGALDVYTKALEACLCTTPGTCAAECGTTMCTGTKADAACSACIAKASACEDQAFTACTNENGCKTLLECAEQSACATKK